MKPATISYLTDIYFEPGALRELPGLLQRFGIERPLVVTDAGVVSVGIMGRVEQVGIGAAVVFDRVETNPTEESVLLGVGVYRENECDGIVAVGGGSPMDCAKAIALLVRHPEPLEQYALIHGGLGKITDEMPPVICIPTTAGTGSEVGRGALITMKSGAKLALISPRLIPEAAICDPLLTVGLPAPLTAATGMDAISHCVETLCSPKFNPVAEAIALDGLVRAVGNIGRAVADGSDVTARGEMMMAALEGGLTFQKGLGAVHALSHPLGALAGRRLHHGMLNAIFLPHVLRFNMEHCREKLERMARALGAGGAGELAGLFESLSATIGLPGRLRELGVSLEEVESQAAAALRDHCSATNPRPVTETDYRRLLREAY